MPLELDLTHRVALVTGSSRGIGRAIALTLAEAGADVVVTAEKNEDRAREVAGEVEHLGRRSIVVVGDLSKPATAERTIGTCADQFGRLDILVNNAGIWEEAAIEEVTAENLEHTLRVNLESAFLLCAAAVPLLKESPAGRIVNVSSTASLLGEPLHSPYAASKAGLDGLTRSLAVELGPHRITVNSVAPGWTVTDMTERELQSDAGRDFVESIPLRKAATPRDIAYAVAFLASDYAGHVTGTTLPVEGAYRIRR